MPNPRGQIVKKSPLAGERTISEFYYLIFRWNEYQWDKNPDLVLDDDEIAELLVRAFPDRNDWSENLVNVGRHRSSFNRGRYKSQKGEVPKKPSRRYERYPGGVRQWDAKAYRLSWPKKSVPNQRTSLDGIQIAEVPD